MLTFEYSEGDAGKRMEERKYGLAVLSVLKTDECVSFSHLV